MTYIIALIVILIIIVLFLLLYSPEYKPESEEEQQEAPLVGLQEEPPPVIRDAVEVVEPGDADHELELSFEEEEIEDEGLELDLAPPDETGEDLAGEHGLNLTFDEETEETPPAPGEPESAPSFEEPELIEPEELEEEIPFIDEEEKGSFRKSEEEVAPALSGFEDEPYLDHEETPEDLEERLNFFFGSEDEETPSAEAEAEEGAEGPEVTAEAEEEAIEVEEPPAAVVPEEEPVPASERYETLLRGLEEKLRQELRDAVESGAIASLNGLEVRLMDICRRQADLQASVADHEKLLAELNDIVDRIQVILPGFHGEALRRSLAEGEGEVARSLLAESAAQLENEPELAARIRYLGGRIAEEETAFAEAFDLYQAACALDGENSDYIYGAGHMAQMLGNDEEAERSLEKLISTDNNDALGIILAFAQHDLARVYVRTNRKDKAEQLLQQALEGMENRYGAEYPGLGPVAHDLAALYESSGRYEEAEPLYKRAIEVMEKGWGPEYPGLGVTLNKLGGLYEEVEREDEAEPLYERALVIKKNLVGEKHPDIGTILNNLANLLKLQGKHDKAEPMFLQSLDIAEKTLGKDHPNLAVVLKNLAELYGEMGDEEKAEQFQERAFALFELPGGGEDFVEMEKDHEIKDIDDEHDQTIAGS